MSVNPTYEEEDTSVSLDEEEDTSVSLDVSVTYEEEDTSVSLDVSVIRCQSTQPIYMHTHVTGRLPPKRLLGHTKTVAGACMYVLPGRVCMSVYVRLHMYICICMFMYVHKYIYIPTINFNLLMYMYF